MSSPFRTVLMAVAEPWEGEGILDIQSTTKKMADVVTSQERCPGKPKSNWTELNKKDAAEWNDNGRLF